MNVLDWPQRPFGSRKGLTRLPEDLRVFRRSCFSKRMCYDRAAPNDLIANLWKDADRAVQSGDMLKDGDRCTVVQIKSALTSKLGKSFVLKRYNLRGPLHTAMHFSLPTRARNCWFFGRQLNSYGILSPQPLAYLEFGCGPFRTRSFLLTEYIDGVHLNSFVENNSSTLYLPETLTDDFASIWGVLGGLRLGHGDLKATNFLVAKDLRLWLIDLDGMRSCSNQLGFRRSRKRDWKRFMKNWNDRPEVACLFRDAVTTRIKAVSRQAA